MYTDLGYMFLVSIEWMMLILSLAFYLDNYVMLPPEGPSQSINCEEKRPLDDSQSILVQQKRGKTNMDPERFLKCFRLFKSL